MAKRNLFLLLVSLCLVNQTIAQITERPERGKVLPDYLLTNVTHYSKKEVSLSEFRGKWLFLDFWFTGCSNCIRSFPKVNAIHNEFKDSINWIMVGMNDKKNNSRIEVLYEKLALKRNLGMIATYDSLLHDRWAIYSMPHIIIVNPAGVIYGITDGRDLTNEKIRDLLRGKTVNFYIKDEELSIFDPNELN